jgi:hypothetical protein
MKEVIMSSTLEKFSEAKKVLKEMVEVAFNDNLLTDEERNNLQSDDQRFRIGIVGQVKTGKSTLINVLIFKKSVMPVASTPMTASLCYLTYGEKPSLEVEFYSNEDWEFIEKEAKRQDTVTDYARELVERALPIINKIKTLLGTTKSISFDELHDYVGEGGKYASIVKSLKIYYPHELLKDIEIVDTPGINDPVVSREKKTEKFLKECDVVIFLIYAGRPFDTVDMNLLRRLMGVGTGKVIFVLNKIDSILEEEGNVDKAISRIKDIIKDEMRKAIKENDTFIEDILNVAKDKIIPLSSLWALLGSLDIKEIENDEDLKFQYERARENFPKIQSQQDFYSASNLQKLIDEMINIMEKDKVRIMLQRPLLLILNRYKEKVENLGHEIESRKYTLKDLDREINVLEEEIKNYDEVRRRVLEEIKPFQRKIMTYLADNRDKFTVKIKDIYSDLYRRIERNIPEKGWLSYSRTYEREVKNVIYRESNEIKQKIENAIISQRESLNSYFQEQIKDLQSTIINSAEDNLTFTYNQYESLIKSFTDTLYDNLNIEIEISIDISLEHLTGGLWTCVTGIGRFKQDALQQIREEVESLKKSIAEEINDSYARIQTIVSNLENEIKSKVLTPIERRLQDAVTNKGAREKRKRELEGEISKLSSQFESFKKRKEHFKEIAERFRLSLKEDKNE